MTGQRHANEVQGVRIPRDNGQFDSSIRELLLLIYYENKKIKRLPWLTLKSIYTY